MDRNRCGGHDGESKRNEEEKFFHVLSFNVSGTNQNAEYNLFCFQKRTERRFGFLWGDNRELTTTK